MPSTSLIFIFILYFLGFFGFTPLSWLGTASRGIVIFLFILINTKKSKYKANFSAIIILLYLFLFLNMISCSIYREQTIYESIRYCYLGTYIYIAYFILRRVNINIYNVEKAFYYLSILFVICYIFQFFNPSLPLFISDDVVLARRFSSSQQRFRFAGQAIISLGFFMCLNKYLLTRQYKYLYVMVLSLFCILLLGFRSLTVALFFSILMLFFKLYGLKRKTFSAVFSVCIILLIFIFTPWGKNVYTDMMERQEEQTFDNTDYIRMISLNYHYTEYFHDTAELVLGSGIPAQERGNYKGSKYSKDIADLQEKGFIYQDWGVIGYSWIMGIGTIICIIWYCLKGFLLKVDKEYYYLGVWLLFLVLGSITTAEMFRPGAPFLMMVVLVLLDKIKGKYEQKKHCTNFS